jgi:hypothetical protein
VLQVKERDGYYVLPFGRRALLERDEEAHAAHALPLREDVQNARRIIAEGPAGLDRLKAARLRGDVALPAAAGAAVGLGAYGNDRQ